MTTATAPAPTVRSAPAPKDAPKAKAKAKAKPAPKAVDVGATLYTLAFGASLAHAADQPKYTTSHATLEAWLADRAKWDAKALALANTMRKNATTPTGQARNRSIAGLTLPNVDAALSFIYKRRADSAVETAARKAWLAEYKATLKD